ncbi:hypothetical protein ACL6C3_00350 [Capilliphycus salinus ALCB114379]
MVIFSGLKFHASILAVRGAIAIALILLGCIDTILTPLNVNVGYL